MSIKAVNGCRLIFNTKTKDLIVKANGVAAEMLGCPKGVKSARFMINPDYVAENPQMLTSPYNFAQEIRKGVEAMRTAEANGCYRDISNELL